MTDSSNKLRRPPPLSVKAVGFLFDRGVTAYANWDRLIVRTEHDQVLLDHESQNHLLHSRMEFVDNRFLVVPFGSGMMLNGFKVYDFQCSKWALDLAFGTANETGFCGAHPAAPVIAVQEADGLGLWDLLGAFRSSLLPISDCNVAALGGPDNQIAIGTWEEIKIFADGTVILSAPVCTGDVVALAWNVSQASLLYSDALGNFMQLETKPILMTNLFGRIEGGINTIQVSPVARQR